MVAEGRMLKAFDDTAFVFKTVAGGHVLPPGPSWSGEAPFGIQGLPEPLLVVLAAFVGFGVALPAMAGGDSLRTAGGRTAAAAPARSAPHGAPRRRSSGSSSLRAQRSRSRR